MASAARIVCFALLFALVVTSQAYREEIGKHRRTKRNENETKTARKTKRSRLKGQLVSLDCTRHYTWACSRNNDQTGKQAQTDIYHSSDKNSVNLAWKILVTISTSRSLLWKLICVKWQRSTISRNKETDRWTLTQTDKHTDRQRTGTADTWA